MRTRRAGWLAVLAVAVAAWPAEAKITNPPRLKTLLDGPYVISVVKVEKLDPARPSVVLAVEAELKGKMPAKSVPMLLKGDAEAAKEKQTELILKRLARDMPVVLFVGRRGEDYIGFAYTNGTWFQFLGHADGEAVRWQFTHTEPYLRRTFKGPTAQMRKTVEDALAGKAAPPEPNLKEEPGYGPEAEPDKSGRAAPPSFSPLPGSPSPLLSGVGGEGLAS